MIRISHERMQTGAKQERPIKSASFDCGLRLAVLLSAISTIGCRQDEVQRYETARIAVKAKRPTIERAMRTLGVIVPREEDAWFFKLTGSPDELAPLTDAFVKFITSIRFDADGKAVTWTLPEGWREEAGGGFRYATLRTGPGERASELTVTKLEKTGDAGEILPNINRWRGQLGLNPISEKDLPAMTKQFKIDRWIATLVDIESPGARSAAKSQMAASSPKTQSPLRFKLPDGWKEAPSASSFAVATLVVEAEGQRADVTVTPLSGPAGGLYENINRWRTQIGLERQTEQQIAKDLLKITVSEGGVGADYVDLTGPGGRILGAVLVKDGDSWFLKMRGPADFVGKQKAAFEAFVASIRFEQQSGEKP